MKTKKRAKKIETDSLFMKSFKEIDKRLIHIVMLDALFYLALFGILLFTFTSLNWNFEAVKESVPTLTDIVGDIEGGKIDEDMTQKLTEINAIFYMAIARTILILVVIFIVSLMVGILFKGLIWAKILHKKFDIHFYKRFALLNILWIIPWALIIVVFLFAIQSMIVFWYIIGIIILFLHFTNIIYVLFEKKKKFSIILKDTFILGVEKIRYFLIPYLLIALVFFILVHVLGLFSFLPWKIYVVFFVLILLVFFAWVRVYVSNVILDKLE